MERELDIAAGHLITWLKDDIKARQKSRFEIAASRSFVAEPMGEDMAELGLNEDIGLMSTIGLLEVLPMGKNNGKWLLRVRVEDIVGPHLPEAGSVPDEMEELSLEGFETDFILPDRGTAIVSLEVETPQGEKSFEAFLGELLTDRHEP